MIYEPREDSFFLLSFLKKYCSGKVLEIGCGSGILMEEALNYSKDVLGVDIDDASVKYCKDRGLNVHKSDLFSKVKGKFDLIIFNPPYLPLDIDEDAESRRATTGGKVGNEIIKRFFNEAKDFLAEKGKILILISSLTPDFEKIVKKNKLKFKLLGIKKEFFEQLKVYLIWKSL